MRVQLFGDPAGLPADAHANYALWAQNHDVETLTPEAVFSGSRPDIVIDAIFGIGLKRPLPPELMDILQGPTPNNWAKAAETKCVAVNCPSWPKSQPTCTPRRHARLAQG